MVAYKHVSISPNIYIHVVEYIHSPPAAHAPAHAAADTPAAHAPPTPWPPVCRAEIKPSSRTCAMLRPGGRPCSRTRDSPAPPPPARRDVSAHAACQPAPAVTLARRAMQGGRREPGGGRTTAAPGAPLRAAHALGAPSYDPGRMARRIQA